MSRYFYKSTKTGDFHPQRTHSGSLFVILERLASIRAVVLAFTANKQTLSMVRECGSTLYVGMAQGVSFPLYIGIGAKFENTQKTYS